MAAPSATASPLRWGGSPPRGGRSDAEGRQQEQVPFAGTSIESGVLKVEPTRSRSSSSSPAPPDRAPCPRRPRERIAAARGTPAAVARRSAVALPCCTPTPTPTATPSQTPPSTPTCTPPRRGARGDSDLHAGLPPVPAFSSRFSPACVPATAGTDKKGARSPFAGQGGPFSGEAGGQVGGGRDVAGERRGGMRARAAAEPGCGRQDQASREAPSIESEVTGMLDESKGTLRLARDGLGDERVPSLTLERLKEVYRTGRGSVHSWRAIANPANGDQGGAATTALVKVEQGRLGVLSSHEAYIVEFKENEPSSVHVSDPARQLARVDEVEVEEEEFQLVYLWIGARAGVEACEAARTQGKRLLEQHRSSMSRTPLLEVEQGCEPALFLALFSYMLPPLAAVVLQGRDEKPDLRVLELQESPCLDGSGIVIAVEGPCSASLLAQYGPMPGRSYICLVRPRCREVGRAKGRSGVEHEGGESVGTFDAAYYWHGVGETPAVEEVGILLCQQVDRMFPSPDGRGKRKGGGRRRRRPCGVGLGGGMMKGYVADVKLGLPVPDGFWACLLPERPTSSSCSVFASQDRRLLSQDLRPESRSRPVRVFGVCGGSKKARQSFVWEVTTGGMPSQMRLSPSLSHVVDAGASCVYVWHGIGSSRDDRRLAWRVASAYAARVPGGASVEQADAGSEPVGLLDCFMGWNQGLVEPPPMLSFSPGRRHLELESNADLSSLATPTSTDGKGSTPVGRHDQRWSRQRSSSRGASSGSVSSGSRLTPPGQRTPNLSLASPPSLKNLAGGINPLPRRCAALPEGLPANPEAFSPPPRQHPATCGSIPGCGSFASPSCLLGFTACVDAFTADRTALNPRSHGGAAAPASTSSGSFLSAIDRSDDDSSRHDAAHPSPRTAAGNWALPDLERNSRGAGGARGEGGEHPTSAVKTCGGGHGESGAGDDDSRREPSGDGGRGKDKRTGDDAGESGWGGDEEGEGAEGRQRNGGGGGGGEGGSGEGGDDGDGTRNNGSGTQGVGEEEVEEEEDGEEAEGRDPDEEMDTFLRLSEVDFCEGVDVLQLRGACAAARDSSIGGPSGGGGGDENFRVIPRHLSDFFRSPLALDSTPKQSSSPIMSLSDIQTGARLFGSGKSPGSDDDGAFRVSGSGNLYIPACSSTVDGTTAEVATSVLINCVGSPPSSASPAAGAAARVPDSSVAAEFAASANDQTEHAPTAEIDEFPAKTSTIRESAVAEVSDGPCEPDGTGAVGEEETEQPDFGQQDQSIGDGGGGESEEEWLTGEAVEPPLEKWRDNSRSPNLGATSTPTQKARPKAEKTAATVGTHWAGLNDDGSWRTEVARKAAGKAGEVEAERRRLAKILADESWRSDAGEGGSTGPRSRRNVRRDSVIRLQSGNVRNKLNAFQGSSGSNAGKDTSDNRSSIGALHGRGLVSAWTKKCTVRAFAATTAQAVPPSAPIESGKKNSLGHGEDRPTFSAEERTHSRPVHMDSADEPSDEFVWKAGPAPCRLQGRPSLSLIRNGQVRIMTKALILSCPAGGDEEAGENARNCEQADVHHDGNSSGGSVEPPVPSRPPPPPPRVSEGTPPPLPERPSPGGRSNSPGQRPLPARPLSARPLPAQPSARKGNFWLAKAGLTRKKRDGMSPASAPTTPPRNGGAWQQGDGTLTPPPTCAAGRTGAGVAAAVKVLDSLGSPESPSVGATGAWAKLRRRLDVEGQRLSGEGRSEAMSHGVASG